MFTPSRGNNFMFFSNLFGTLIVPLIIAVIIVFFRLTKVTSTHVEIIIISSLYIIPFLAYMTITKQKFKEIVPMKKIDVINLVLVIFITISLIPISGLISSVSSLFFKNEVGESILLRLVETPFWLMVIKVCIFPALFEEIAYRGIILSNYKNIEPKKAALINGLFFGIAHMNVHQFFYAFFIGVVYSYFVRYSKSIFTASISHFLFNFYSVSLSYFIMQNAIKNGETIQEVLSENNQTPTAESILFIAIIAAIFLPVFIILFKTFISYNQRKVIKDELVNYKETVYDDYSEQSTVETEITDENIGEALNKKRTKILTWSFWATIVLWIITNISIYIFENFI